VPDTEPDSRPATIEVQRDPSGAVRLLVEGEIDLATADQLDDALKEAEQVNPESIVLDLSALRFIDSSGLRVLLMSARRCIRALPISTLRERSSILSLSILV
jgi:anti-anti-sigma factor